MAEPPDEIETIHLWHSEIEHDHVRLDGVEHRKTFLTVRRLEDLELAFERHPVEGSPGRIIVYDKHSRHTIHLPAVPHASGLPSPDVRRGAYLVRTGPWGRMARLTGEPDTVSGK